MLDITRRDFLKASAATAAAIALTSGVALIISRSHGDATYPIGARIRTESANAVRNAW